jgi:hypothetical protein
VSPVIAVTCSDRPGVLEELEAELSARGAAVEVLIPGRQPGLQADSIPAAAAILARHGVVVLVLAPVGGCCEGAIPVSEDELASPESREAFLRRLELSGLIPAGSVKLPGDEEALIRERLQKLGYL